MLKDFLNTKYNRGITRILHEPPKRARGILAWFYILYVLLVMIGLAILTFFYPYTFLIGLLILFISFALKSTYIYCIKYILKNYFHKKSFMKTIPQKIAKIDFLRQILNIVFIFCHPLIIIFNAFYYLLRVPFYFLSVKKSLKLQKNTIPSKYFNVKYCVATTYVLLICDVILNSVSYEKISLLGDKKKQVIIDIYFIIITIDNSCDEVNKSFKKQEKILLIFSDIIKIIKSPQSISYNDCDKLDIKSFKMIKNFINNHLYIWNKNKEKGLIDKVVFLKNAYLYEEHVLDKDDAWKASYNISVGTIDFLIEGLSILFPNCDFSNANKQVLYTFMFAGNIVDDWMDYYWTKEDVGKKCFMEFLNKEYRQNYSYSGFLFNNYSFFMSASHLTKTVFLTQSENKYDIKINWLLPSFMIITIFTGPASILIHKLLKVK